MPTDLDTKLIEHQIGAVSSRRMMRWTEGTCINATAVVLQYHDQLLTEVQVNSVRYRTSIYVPNHKRCSVCQHYSHRAADCRRLARCVRCGDQHDFLNCPVKDDITKHRCRHSAAFSALRRSFGCRQQQECLTVMH